tara:strand:- start:700 stop:1323 length:624 start_codon:yes stop_codon:yes gene_type:complete
MFVGTNFTFQSHKLQMEGESFQRLPEKSFEMLRRLARSDCRAGLKIDEDAQVCVRRFSLNRAMLPNVYAGILTPRPFTEWPKGSKYWTPVQAQLRRRGLARPYMEGAAYVVGANLARHVVRKEFGDYFNTFWEDANLGIQLSDSNMTVHKVRAGSICHKCKRRLSCATTPTTKKSYNININARVHRRSHARPRQRTATTRRDTEIHH